MESKQLLHWIEDIRFLVFLVTWYEPLFKVCVVSKELQKTNSDIEQATMELENLCNFTSEYRSTGFQGALAEAHKLS